MQILAQVAEQPAESSAFPWQLLFGGIVGVIVTQLATMLRERHPRAEAKKQLQRVAVAEVVSEVGSLIHLLHKWEIHGLTVEGHQQWVDSLIDATPPTNAAFVKAALVVTDDGISEKLTHLKNIVDDFDVRLRDAAIAAAAAENYIGGMTDFIELITNELSDSINELFSVAQNRLQPK